MTEKRCVSMGRLVACVVPVLIAGTASFLTATNQSTIQGSWYRTVHTMSGTDAYERLDFNSDGTFVTFTFTPIQQNQLCWSAEGAGALPRRYAFQAPTEILIQQAPELRMGWWKETIVIESLTADSLHFHYKSGGSEYVCTRTRPPGDTESGRRACAAELEKIRLGRWRTRDGGEYFEFMPDGTCVNEFLRDGRQQESRGKFSVRPTGALFCSASAGGFGYEPPNKINLTGNDPNSSVTYYRTRPTEK
jgi:hypothetical protein